jgi:alanine dehydrogenase
VLYTYLHLAPDPEQTAALVKSGAVCVAYETIHRPERRPFRCWRP